MRNRKLIRNLLIALVVSGVLLALVIQTLDWQTALTYLQALDWRAIPIIWFIWTLGLLVRTIRWYYLLDKAVPLLKLYHIHNIGLLVNNLIPLRAGEVTRVILTSRHAKADLSVWSALSTIVAERIFDILAIVLLLALVLTQVTVSAEVTSASILLGILALVGFFVLLFFVHRPAIAHAILKRILAILPILRRFGLETLLERALSGLAALKTSYGLLQVIFWSLMAGFALVAEVWVLTLAFPDLSLSDAIVRNALVLAVTLASLSIVVPLTFAGAGPFEAAVIFGFVSLALPKELGLAFAIVWHGGILLNYLLWGIIGVIALSISPAELSEELDKVTESIHDEEKS